MFYLACRGPPCSTCIDIAFVVRYAHSEEGVILMAASMPNDFVRRDEMNRALEEQLERVTNYVGVSLDSQRVKMVRQVVNEIGADTEKRLAALQVESEQRQASFEQRLLKYIDQRFTHFQQETLKYMDMLQRQTVQEIVQALQKPI